MPKLTKEQRKEQKLAEWIEDQRMTMTFPEYAFEPLTPDQISKLNAIGVYAYSDEEKQRMLKNYLK